MVEELGRSLTGPSGWLVLLAIGIVVVYLAGLIVWSRRRTSEPGHVAAASSRPAPSPAAGIPAWATARGRPAFIVTAAVVAVALWLVAWVITPDRAAFMASREWQAQPLYLFAHFATVRVFASILASNYIEGAAALDAPPAASGAAVRRVLGLGTMGMAAVAALPFIAIDLRYFLSTRYAKLSGGADPATADWLMFGIWTIEWLLNALVWCMLIRFLALNVRTLRHHTFSAPIHVVLMFKHYRPFLRMSAQGATVVLAFSVVTALYILYASGELTDYAGLIVTVALLGVCFLPPWLIVRAKVKRIVQQDIAVLQRAVSAETAAQLVASVGDPSAGSSRHGAEALVMMRMVHLDRMYDDVGRREATEVAIRLLAPAATIGWQLWQNGGAVLERLMVWLRALGA